MLFRVGVLVKYILSAPFLEMKKSPKSFAKLRAAGVQKTADKFLSPVRRLYRYSVVREFKTTRKGKNTFFIFKYAS